MRAFKTVNDTYIEPISFTVPRRAETFQSDIYPACTGLKPAMSANEWLSGKTALPPKIDLESVYEGNTPKEVAADYKPPAAAAPAPAPAPVAKPAPKEPEPTPVATRAPPPSMAQQKGSMAAAASKFQDNEEEEEDGGETSSFEEVQRPAPKASLPLRSEPAKPASPVKSTAPAASVQLKAPSPIKATAPISAVRSAQPSPALSPSSASGAVEASLEQIKQLIEAQTKIITAQGDKLQKQSEAINQLTGEVETLKKRVVPAGNQDQSERIRQLELELEEARS